MIILHPRAIPTLSLAAANSTLTPSATSRVILSDPVLMHTSLRSVPIILYLTDLGLFRRLLLSLLEALQDTLPADYDRATLQAKQRAVLERVERVKEDAVVRCKEEMLGWIGSADRDVAGQIKVLCAWQDG